MSRPMLRLTPDEYQEAATAAQLACSNIFQAWQQAFYPLATTAKTIDAGPFVSGLMCSLIDIYVRQGVSDAKIRADVTALVADMLPKVREHHAATKAGMQ